MDTLTPVNPIERSGLQTANYFRLGWEGAANDSLTQFIDILSSALAEEVLYKHPQLPVLLENMFLSQQERNILRLADIIQYEILPLFAEKI